MFTPTLMTGLAIYGAMVGTVQLGQLGAKALSRLTDKVLTKAAEYNSRRAAQTAQATQQADQATPV
jgi:hypothetical protein